MKRALRIPLLVVAAGGVVWAVAWPALKRPERGDTVRDCRTSFTSLEALMKQGLDPSFARIEKASTGADTLADSDFAAIEKEALHIAACAERVVALHDEPTVASTDEFQRLAHSLAEDASRLAARAGKRDEAGMRSGVADLRADCSRCHRQFRDRDDGSR